MSRADYVKMSETCKRPGLPIASKPIRLEGNSTAIVRWEIGSLGRTYTLLYELGHWKVGPTSEFKTDLGKPVDKIIATLKAEGSC